MSTATRLSITSAVVPSEFAIFEALKAEWSARCGFRGLGNPFALPVAFDPRYEELRTIVAVFQRMIENVLRSLVIVAAPDADLAAADVEILERAYMAIGAELDKRKGRGV